MYTDRNGYPLAQLFTELQRACDRMDPKAAIELAAEYFNESGFGQAREVFLDDCDNVTTDETDKRAVYFATGGWSGCEEVVDWLDTNVLTRSCWVSSHRGGAHVYELRVFK